MDLQTPEDLDRAFAQALNAGDLDAVAALYEPDATLCPQPGQAVTGTPAIRQALAGFIAGKPRMTIAPRVVARSGDLALVTSQWQLAITGPDGKPVQMSGQSVEVMRRQADGRWLFVIDQPFGLSG